AQRAAELLARRGVVARLVVGVAPEGERARGIADALDVEARNLLLEAAGSEQDVFRRHAAVLEMQLAPLLAAHEARRRADGEARAASAPSAPAWHIPRRCGSGRNCRTARHRRCADTPPRPARWQ